MVTTYNPSHPSYFDETDLHSELERIFEICHSCRLCFNLCPAFPTLFNFIDANGGDVSKMRAEQQDQVMSECYNCKLCFLKCPYVPPHEWQLDFPRAQMRTQAIMLNKFSNPSETFELRKRRNWRNLKKQLSLQFFSRTDLVGKMSVRFSSIVNQAMARPGSLFRKVAEKSVSLSARRMLPPYTRNRFSSWFNRGDTRSDDASGCVARKVTVFPTCLVEYQDPDIGKALVKVYEHNGINCNLPQEITCCGAPWLHGGSVKQFLKTARKNLTALLPEIRMGRDIVVPQPTCAYVIKKDYPLYLAIPEAQILANHTFDAMEYLMRSAKSDPDLIDTGFTGVIPQKVLYHTPCHLRAQNIGLPARDLLKLTGAKVELVQQCSGVDGTWGYKEQNYTLSKEVAFKLSEVLKKKGEGVLCGDCHLANYAIYEESGNKTLPLHPIQILAAAYGLLDDE